MPKQQSRLDMIDVEKLTKNVTSMNPKADDGQTDDQYKLILDMLIKKLLTDVSAYLNVITEDIPEQLYPDILMVITSWIQDNKILLPDEERNSGPVSSITEGDTSVSYAVSQTAVSKISGADFLSVSGFKQTLRRYRKVAKPWGMPYDLPPQ